MQRRSTVNSWMTWYIYCMYVYCYDFDDYYYYKSLSIFTYYELLIIIVIILVIIIRGKSAADICNAWRKAPGLNSPWGALVSWKRPWAYYWSHFVSQGRQRFSALGLARKKGLWCFSTLGWSQSWIISACHMGVSENSVPLNPMVFMIIIHIKWLFHWEYTQHFQTNPVPNIFMLCQVDSPKTVPALLPISASPFCTNLCLWCGKQSSYNGSLLPNRTTSNRWPQSSAQAHWHHHLTITHTLPALTRELRLWGRFGTSWAGGMPRLECEASWVPLQLFHSMTCSTSSTDLAPRSSIITAGVGRRSCYFVCCVYTNRLLVKTCGSTPNALFCQQNHMFPVRSYKAS